MLLLIVALPVISVGFGLTVPLQVDAVVATVVVSALVPELVSGGLNVMVPVTLVQL